MKGKVGIREHDQGKDGVRLNRGLACRGMKKLKDSVRTQK